MENKAHHGRAAKARLGPRPALPRDPGRSLSQSRVALLDRLESQAEPATLGALTTATGLHANTLREHLDALVDQGMVRRQRAEPRGRGRPAWLYERTDADPQSEASEYAGLAVTLAAAMHRGSGSPGEDAVAAGVEWGRKLARGGATRPGADEKSPRARVLDLLDDLGFVPEPDEEFATVRFTRCPLLQAADSYPDVVCGVHLGIVRGALAEFGATATGAVLLPFAEPGACLLELSPSADRETR